MEDKLGQGHVSFCTGGGGAEALFHNPLPSN